MKTRLSFISLLLACSFVQAQSSIMQESYQLEKENKPLEALAKIEQLLAQQPTHELALLRSAWLLHQQGQHAESEKRYAKAIELNPRSIDARLGLMLPQLAQKHYAKVVSTSRRVLADNPAEYTANLRLLISEEALARWPDVSRHASEFAAYYPTDATPLLYWARSEVAQRNTNKARELYSKVLERQPANEEASKYLELTSSAK